MNIQLLQSYDDKILLDVLKLIRVNPAKNINLGIWQKRFRLGFGRALKLSQLLESAGILSDSKKYRMVADKDGKRHREYFKRVLAVSAEELDKCVEVLDNDRYNRIKGSIFGGASGDALGNTAEFLSLSQIKQKYGELGITEPELVGGKALITDDTQMLLFTAEGIFLWEERNAESIDAKPESFVYQSYLDWYYTQTNEEHVPVTRIYGIPELHVTRAPGSTCMRALRSGIAGSIENPLNSSKGSGGVMRVAPVGLYFNRAAYDSDETVMLGAKTAAVTHGHPLGYISAAAMTYIVNELVYGRVTELAEVVFDAADCISRLFGQVAAEYACVLRKAVELAKNGVPHDEAMQYLGEGWCGDSALAVAVYCGVKYDSFADALCAAANIDGDSDTVAAITGNIMGAYLGYDAIPDKLKANLELRDLLESTSYRLWRGCNA